ncbi:MAG TPA: nucleoside triphosphate pyrophosphohydrolase [Balneolales bacterium]|nr:nucleoside triphosphate pyrophosphohydrolase [Balneolales bacterium]
MNKKIKPTRSFDDLVKIMTILRKECPWDRKQTHESIKDLMVEEVYEAIDAIDQQDFEELRKELGDLLLHVVFHSEMANETQQFDIEDVIYGIQEKLIRRHPHVFEDIDADTSEKVARNWEAIKMREKGRESVLGGVPRNLPALLRAQRMQEKAAAVGFDWSEWEDVWAKLEEELQEFREAVQISDKEESKKEFGDLLFSLVNVGRFFDIEAEDSLRMTNNKFQDRFQYIEKKLAEKNLSLNDVTLKEMDVLWEEAKKTEA